MEFRIAGPTDRDQVETLWAYCFEPRENPFFQWYFSHFYEAENVLLGLEQGEMVCVTHLNPYTLRLRGRDVRTSYIVGLATHPAARRGGVGGKLITAALEEMRRRGHYINILMPSRAGFYQPYGYELYCHQWRETLSMDMLRPLTDRNVHFGFVNSPDQWQTLAAVYDVYTQGLSGYALRDEVSWRRHIEGQLAEGCIAVVFDGDKPVGYVFYQLGAPTVQCGEFVYTSYKGKKGILNYLYNHRSQGEAVCWNEAQRDQSYRFYPDGRTGHETMPFMTSRIVDVKGALEAISYPEGIEAVLRITVEDPLAVWNRGTFSLTVHAGTGTVHKEADPAGSVQMTVGALALLVFGTFTASELAYYEKLQGSQEELAILDLLFPQCQNYINEWY